MQDRSSDILLKASTGRRPSSGWYGMEVSFLSYLLAVLVPIIFSLGFISTLLGFVGLLLAAGIISSFIWSLPKRTVQER